MTGGGVFFTVRLRSGLLIGFVCTGGFSFLTGCILTDSFICTAGFSLMGSILFFYGFGLEGRLFLTNLTGAVG